MADEKHPSTEAQQIVEQLFVSVMQSIASGKTPHVVTQGLVQQGVPAEWAEALVARANRLKKAELRKGGRKAVAVGLGLILLGAGITGLTFAMAQAGGIYIVTTGLCAVGGLQVLRGLYRVVVG